MASLREHPALSRIRSRLDRLRTTHLVALCVLFTLALRVPYLNHALMNDEAGLLLVARHWSAGPYLYGHFFVGRGMLAVGVYRLGDALGSPLGLRLLACLFAAGLVVAAGWAGAQIRGRAGAGWGALVAAAYGSTFLFQAAVMNERLVAATIVMASCAMVLSAVRHPESWWQSVAAGVLTTLPLLVVQSYADGLAFAAVFVLASWAVHELDWRQTVRIALGGLGGLAVTSLGVAVTLMLTPMTASQFWFQMIGFRLQASKVIGLHTTRPQTRLDELIVLAASTGILLIVLCLFLAARWVLRRAELRPVWLGVVAMMLISLYGMREGADYWSDYLLQPIPALVLAVSLVAPAPRLSGWGMRLAAVVAAAVAVVTLTVKVTDPSFGAPSQAESVGSWIHDSAQPGDTVFVVWGEANMLYSSGLSSPYPFLWSLLVRTLDHDLGHAVGMLSGPRAPTWVVVWLATNSWDLDSHGRLQHTLDHRYRLVGRPCGKAVYLLRGEHRDVLPDSACG
jgi:hypothetical protein